VNDDDDEDVEDASRRMNMEREWDPDEGTKTMMRTTWTCAAGHTKSMVEDLGDPADRELVAREDRHCPNLGPPVTGFDAGPAAPFGHGDPHNRKDLAKGTGARPRPDADLTDEECACVRRALRFLRTRLGGTKALAAALGMTPGALAVAMTRNRRPSAALALRTARLAKASIDAVLRGEWPPEGACPHCGRG
jgi:hypothetical protein